MHEFHHVVEIIRLIVCIKVKIDGKSSEFRFNDTDLQLALLITLWLYVDSHDGPSPSRSSKQSRPTYFRILAPIKV
jgi:hypothetical protein